MIAMKRHWYLGITVNIHVRAIIIKWVIIKLQQMTFLSTNSFIQIHFYDF